MILKLLYSIVTIQNLNVNVSHLHKTNLKSHILFLEYNGPFESETYPLYNENIKILGRSIELCCKSHNNALLCRELLSHAGGTEITVSRTK